MPTVAEVIALEPLAALEANTGFRRYDVTGDLHMLDEWSAAVAAGAPTLYTAPMLVPEVWPEAAPVSQADYDHRFAEEFAAVASILPIEHVVVAGGAAAWPLGGDAATTPSDIDLFIVGIDPADTGKLWSTVGRIARKLRNAFSESTKTACVVETMVPGLVCFRPQDHNKGGTQGGYKVQVILRAFPSVSALLHGFDVPSCCVAYDGTTAVMTGLAAWAHAYRINLVCPAYRSTTFEQRLLKYFKRGFALGLPHLDPSVLVAGSELNLPWLDLHPTAVQAGSGFAVGTATLADPTAPAMSDYDPEVGDADPVTADHEHGAVRWDSWAASARYNLQRLLTDQRYALRKANYIRDDSVAVGGLDFSDFAEVEPGLEEVFDFDTLTRILRYLRLVVVRPACTVNLWSLQHDFGLSPHEVAQFCQGCLETLNLNPGSSLRANVALMSATDRICRLYGDQPDKIAWWITIDPSRQYTAALNPMISDPAAWYGHAVAYMAASVPQAVTVVARGARVASAMPAIYHDGNCPICMTPVVPGATNSVVLKCGHVFHWSRTVDCGGLLAWTRANEGCPTCRAHLDSKPKTASTLRRPVVDIEW